MPRKYIRKSNRSSYTLEALSNAIDDIKEGRLTFREASAKHGVPFGTLAKKLSGRSPLSSIVSGRKTVLPPQSEEELCEFLKVSGKYGFGLSKNELKDLVRDYVTSENIKTPFKENRPGDDWVLGYLKRHPSLSIRAGEKLTNARSKAADPFVVEKFYKDIEEILRTENLSNRPEALYNCDETGFQLDPSNMRILAEKGQRRVSRNVPGSGKETVSVMACCNAAGDKMPPMIIFRGKNIWSSWISEEAYPGTAYAASENGWMEETVFEQWFTNVFLKGIPSLDERDRKVVLFMDGCKSHMSGDVIQKAIQNRVILFKLPPNLTHLLQPLDKAVFRPVKQCWNELLMAENRANPCSRISKRRFSELLKDCWIQSFKSQSIKSGFSSCGIFPCDKDKFPREAYDPVKLERYENGFTRLQDSRLVHDESDGVSYRRVNDNDGILAGGSNTTMREEMNEHDVNPQETDESFENFIRKRLSSTPITSRLPDSKRRKVKQTQYGEVLTATDALNRISEIKPKTAKKKERAPLPSTTASILDGDYVSTVYNGSWYLGEVVDTADMEYQIQFLQTKGNNKFIWPDTETMKREKIWLFQSDILMTVQPPFPAGGRFLQMDRKDYELSMRKFKRLNLSK